VRALLYLINMLKKTKPLELEPNKELQARNCSTWIRLVPVLFGAGRQRGRVHGDPAHRVERLRQQHSSNSNESSWNKESFKERRGKATATRNKGAL